MTTAGTRRIRKRERVLDLRLLVPVLVAWPAVAFGALVRPLAQVAIGSAILAGIATLSAVLAARRPGRGRRLVALTLATIALASTAAVGHRALRSAGPIDALATERGMVTVTGRVATDAREVVSGIRDEGGTGSMFIVRVKVSEVTARGRTTQVSTPVLVIGDADWAGLEWHDEIEFTARLGESEPGDDVAAVATPKGTPRVIDRAGGIFEVAAAVRARFRAATDHLPADARGLVPALVIGDTSRTPPDLTAAMLTTGMSHLSAVSGSNVTLVLAAAMGLCGLLGIRRRWRPLVALAVLAGFVVLARPEPSVVRAAVMGSVGLLGLSTSRRQVGIPALAGAILALLVWDPWLARSYGFALSSVATLGLLVFAQPWGRAIARQLPRRLRGLGPVLAVPVAAQAVCAPIVVPLQGSVSLIAVVANLLAAPLVAPTTIVGVFVAVLAVAWVGGAGLLAWGAGLPAQAIGWIARWCATVPMGSIDWDASAWGAIGLAALTVGVVLVAPWAWHRSRLRPLLAAAVVVVTVAFTLPTRVVSWPPPGWVLVACDVGEGDGLVVSTGVGHAIVVDTGTDPAVVDGCLTRLDVSVVDLVVLTHFHADHAGGLEGVLDGRTVRQLLVSPVKEPLPESQRVASLARAAAIPMGELRVGDGFTVGEVRADVWGPGRPIMEGSVPNNGSIVLTLHVRGIGVLLTGDMEREAAAEVVRAAAADPGRWGAIDILKVPHHGSSNRDDRVLGLVDGRLAIISVGADNDYGHPSPSLLRVLEQRGFAIHRTDLEGDLAVVVSREGITVRSR